MKVKAILMLTLALISSGAFAINTKNEKPGQHEMMPWEITPENTVNDIDKLGWTIINISKKIHTGCVISHSAMSFLYKKTCNTLNNIAKESHSSESFVNEDEAYFL